MTVQDNQVLQRDADGNARVTLDSGEIITLAVGGPYEVGGAKNVLVGDLWVLAGQSNMEGVGDLVEVEPPHPLVHSFQSREKWARAEEPLHWLNESPRPIHHVLWGLPMPEMIAPRDPNRIKGAGLGLTFAKTLAEQTYVPIGLIPAAHGGTSMQQWEPSRKGQGGHSLYGATLERVKANGGKVAGILWYQGESDANPADAALYEARMTALVQSFRADFGQPNLPLYYVQLGIFACDPSPDGVDGWNRIRESQRTWQDTVPNTGMVSAIDCGLDDGIHIDTPGLKALGRRLAAVASGKPAPNLKSVTYEPGQGWLRVSFDHVQGGLTALGRPNGFTLRDAEGVEQAIIHKTALDGSDALVKITEPARLPGLSLWYGYGFLPYCNITDATGASIPAFGPVRVD
ncbi:MAG: sialate O-acetylesterase [Armatimonadota bacterium]|nr:sialate O-acetylesterase [Armatimonadota bacterium]